MTTKGVYTKDPQGQLTSIAAAMKQWDERWLRKRRLAKKGGAKK